MQAGVMRGKKTGGRKKQGGTKRTNAKIKKAKGIGKKQTRTRGASGGRNDGKTTEKEKKGRPFGANVIQ